MSTADAATERDSRQTVKATGRTQPVAAPAQHARPAKTGSRAAALPSPPPASSAAVRTASQRGAPQAATRPAQNGRASFQSPAGEAASFGLVRPAFAQGGGTPILPVSATSGLSCVPFARMATGIAITGDARLWWHNAAGVYARGSRPERGSVLTFAASGGMSRGHVAVVSAVMGPRDILIDHANWAGPGIRRGTVMRGVRVTDVSDRNDWTAVRVQVGHDPGSFGRTYATYGFIYNRPIGSRTLMTEAERFDEVADASGLSPHAAQHMALTAEAFDR